MPNIFSIMPADGVSTVERPWSYPVRDAKNRPTGEVRTGKTLLAFDQKKFDAREAQELTPIDGLFVTSTGQQAVLTKRWVDAK